MKKYQVIQPEVVVGLGKGTEFLEKEPPFKTVTKLHLLLEDWLGDDLIECYPCYIVTKELKEKLDNTEFKGFEFLNMTVTKGDNFRDNYQLDKPLPKFYWMKIFGVEGDDDIFIGESNILYIENQFLEYLQNISTTNYLVVNPSRNEFDDLLDRMLKDRLKDK